MKLYYSISLVLILASCNNVKSVDEGYLLPPKVKSVTLQLVDSLGMITFKIPENYDTAFYWVHYSDCGKSCDKQKYRFQSKDLQIKMESGWLWNIPKDSTNSFTISHSGLVVLRDDGRDFDSIRHGFIKNELIMNGQNPPIIFDTIQKINDRYFSIIAMDKSDTIQVKKIVASTVIKSNEIKFECDLITKKNDSISKNFIKNSINLIKTIRISKGI